MIVVVGSNKGGTGKTTTAVNLAVALANKKEVCLVDADFQRSTSRWYNDRENANINSKITLIEKYDNIAKTLEELDKKFDYIIVDVAGRNSREMITGLSVSDILISPHQASQLDLDTIQELQSQIMRIKDINPKLKAYVLHSMASTNPSVRKNERHEFENYLRDYPDLKLLYSCCFYRKIYRDVMPIGQSVIESSNVSAKNEILEIVNEVL